MSCSNQKIRFLCNSAFEGFHKEIGGQAELPSRALYNAASVPTQICEAAGTAGLIFCNRISLMCEFLSVWMTCIQ